MLSAQEEVQGMRQYMDNVRAARSRVDLARAVLIGLRGDAMRMFPLKGTSANPRVPEVSYADTRGRKREIAGLWFDDAKVRRLLRRYLECDQEPNERSNRARHLADALYANVVTRGQLGHNVDTLYDLYQDLLNDAEPDDVCHVLN